MDKIKISKIPKPEDLLKQDCARQESREEIFYHNGIPLEKNAKLSEKRIDKNIEIYEFYADLFMQYPDLYLELIKPTDSKFQLKFFQIIFLRTCLRYGRTLTIAPRAAGKSFICVLALYLICIFRPKSKTFICSPGKQQSVKIAGQKIRQIWDIYPLLRKELNKENFGADYITLGFKNGSEFTIMTPLNSTRGNRANCGILDEYRDHDANDVAEIILPLLNVDRSMVNGDKNENEPQQVQLWISSAGDKNTFSYDKTIEMLEQSIIQPSKFFCWGFDWRIPVLTGLLSKDYLNELRLSPTFNEIGFAKEYMSRFVGSSEEAWFDFEKIDNQRKIINPETHNMIQSVSDIYYIISVDLGRRDCQSIATVLKVFPKKDEGYRINLVNLFVLGKTEEEKQFNNQVIELKKLIELFQPKKVIIDINGLGIAFADQMIKETWDEENQKKLPAYSFSNRPEYFPLQSKKSEKILYGIKANAQINSDMHSALYSKIYSGHLSFLISEQEARNKLLSTHKGQRLTPEEKNARLLPHELTTLLINEIVNLKVRTNNSSNQISIERINERMTKDKFSALEMGVYYITQEEAEENSRRKNRGLRRSLTFTSSSSQRGGNSGWIS